MVPDLHFQILTCYCYEHALLIYINEHGLQIYCYEHARYETYSLTLMFLTPAIAPTLDI